MALVRYISYFVGIALVTWLLTRMEINAPGNLRLQEFTYTGDTLGTSEFSPLELLQPFMLIICGLLYAWVAWHYPSQRPIAFGFGGLALAFTIRELDFFLDRYIVDNFWQVIVALVSALIITYTYRHRKRFRIAWLRLWPSPGLTLLFAGAVIQFAFVRLVGHEPLWMAILGDDYLRIIKLAVEEFIELIGYFLWTIGTVEYVFQVRVIATREPLHVAAKRRAGRQPKSKGRY
ncbi:MAG TPA: hypothetical protein VFY27_08670 [Woeseiaceae bacterium]|nr:hypothetical protein [Woeseiaceae bacterium]